MTATLIAAPPYRSPEWHEWRRHGLGASDIPDLLGCGYRSEYELWHEKKHGAERESTDVMRFGAYVEGYALDWYETTNGVTLARGETFGDDRWPHLWATTDGRAGRIGVEVKYDTKGWAVIPRKHEVQALAQIGLGDLDAVDVLRVSTRGDVTPFRVERDDALITDLLGFAEDWWARYIIGDEEPPLDGSPAARRALDRFRGDAEREADERQASLLADLQVVRKRIASFKKLDERIVADLKASMAGVGVLTTPGARVTWSAVKGKRDIDWEAIAKVAGSEWDREVWEALVRSKTIIGEPGTRFAVKFDDEEEAA